MIQVLLAKYARQLRSYKTVSAKTAPLGENKRNMKIRIQPSTLEIPHDQPFKNDLLGRETPARILTRLAASLEGPCVLSIDGAYGSGKTTFLQLWAQHLENEKFRVVRLNAWETDHSGDPLLALSEGIMSDLRKGDDASFQEKLEDFGHTAGEVILRAAPAAIRMATVGMLDVAPLLGQAVGELTKEATKARIDAFTSQRATLAAFKAKLQSLAAAAAETDTKRPLVILIDELDRCRPTYAIEMLEVAKHLFSADNVIFAMAINRSQLAHSAKALYGQEFAAADYLKRFFDIDFRLPEPDRAGFVTDLLKRTGLDMFSEPTPAEWAQQEKELFQEILSKLLGQSSLTLRQISQAIHHLALVFASLDHQQPAFALPSAMAIILKYVLPESYDLLRRGEPINDIDHLEALFTALGVPPQSERVRSQHRDTYATTEAIFAACAVEASPRIQQLPHQIGHRAPPATDYWSSGLNDKYELNQINPSTDDQNWLSYARQFNRIIDDFDRRLRQHPSVPVGFLLAAERIELLESS